MTRDYAHLNLHKKSRPKIRIWAFIIILLGLTLLFIWGAHYVKRHHVTTPKEPTKPLAVVRQATPVETIQPLLPDTQKTENPQPNVTFDFYTMLPRMSVNTLNHDALTAQQQTMSSQHDSYILQIVSLANKDDATDYLEKLNQAGFKAKLIPVFQNHTKWYRIQMGPYKTLQDAEKIRDALQEQDISSILITQHP